MKHKLTVGYVRNLPLSEKQADIYDTELSGFGVRISQTKKIFFVRKRVKGRMTRVTVGDSAVMNADTARKRAMEIILRLSDGVDVNRERKKSQERGITLGSVMGMFFSTRTKIKLRTEQTYRELVKLYLSGWLNIPLSDITPEMCARKHLQIGKEHGKAAANNCFRTFRLFYNFAGQLEELPDNPVKRLSATRQWFGVERRGTVIKPSDLPAWYEAANSLDNPIIRNYLLLMLFTGLRRNEAAGLKWENVDLDSRLFTVLNTKNGKPHTLPASAPIYEILREMRTLRENDFVFAGIGKSGHINNPKRQMAKITEKTGIAFCIHDLRRTFASIAESCVSYTVLKRLMNHTDRDVTQGYLILSQEKMRGEMEKISREILSLAVRYPLSAQELH